MSYIVAVAARWTKSLKFTLSIAFHRGGLAKNNFWLVATQKKRIGEQLNYFWNMCPKRFSWAKKKRKLFSDGKSRGPLLARAALEALSCRCGAFLFSFITCAPDKHVNMWQVNCFRHRKRKKWRTIPKEPHLQQELETWCTLCGTILCW